jgi:aarF domain-containing kinase
MCQVMQRSARAVYCGASIFVEYKFRWTPENASDVHGRVARLIVDTCKANEGLFVKFGQLLGSMQVALPPEYVGPLGELHDQAKTFDSATVRRMLEEELPDTYHQLQHLSELPVASASVAQVHTAYLNGMKVAVKVQKPNIRVQNNWDLFIFKAVLTCLEYSFEIPMVWSYDFVREQLQSELDFTVEASNARQCRLDLLAHRDLSLVAVVPETFDSSVRVVVTEWIDDAVKITDTKRLREMGIDSRAVIRDATRMFAYQIFGSGHVHCDPHPGNLLVRRKPKSNDSSSSSSSSYSSSVWSWINWGLGRPPAKENELYDIVLIDHGLYVHLNEELRSDYISFWMAMIVGDDAALVDMCRKWGIHDSELFSSMTLMRRRDKKPKSKALLEKEKEITAAAAAAVATSTTYENEEGHHHAHTLPTGEKEKLNEAERLEKTLQAVERSRKLKERVKHFLSDTSRFPHELGFVNRSVNYIRATNWAHGSPIDRVAIFAEAAARASVGDRGRVGDWSPASPYSVWDMHAHIAARLWAPELYYNFNLNRVSSSIGSVNNNNTSSGITNTAAITSAGFCNKSTIWK